MTFKEETPRPAEAYSRRDRAIAVNLSAVLGWFAVNVAILWGAIDITPGNLLFWFLWSAAIGLPISFVFCWLFVAPILRVAMRRGFTWTGAAMWGGSIACLILVSFVVLDRVGGWPDVLDTLSAGVLVQKAVVFVMCGVGIGLVVRGFIGPGMPTQPPLLGTAGRASGE